MNWRILLLIRQMTLEPLERINQYWWCFEYLDLLNSLLVRLALAAVPLVLPRKLFRSIEQAEAVIDGDLISIELHVLVTDLISLIR